MNNTQYDVVIAGAGPSGCAAAITLKMAGINVCLADKEYAGNRKIGESIPGASVRLLNRLGINGMDSLLKTHDYKPCLSNISSWGNENWEYQSGMSNPEGGGYHINRVVFDKALQTKAILLGIPLYEDHVDNIVPIVHNNITLGHSIKFKYKNQEVTTKWIIDATGRKAAIGRKFGLERERIDNQMSVIKWIDTQENDIDHATRIKSVADGWWYTSLLPDRSRVISFQALPETVIFLHKHPDVFFRRFNETRMLSHETRMEKTLQTAAVESGVARYKSVVSNGFLSVGDAALSNDPLSSQGIFFGLYSGIKGAEAIKNSLTNGNDMQHQIFDKYQQLINNIFAENEKLRKYFYMSEFRFYNEPYWQNRRNSVNRV